MDVQPDPSGENGAQATENKHRFLTLGLICV